MIDKIRRLSRMLENFSLHEYYTGNVNDEEYEDEDERWEPNLPTEGFNFDDIGLDIRDNVIIGTSQDISGVVEIPYGVESIAKGAFSECHQL